MYTHTSLIPRLSPRTTTTNS